MHKIILLCLFHAAMQIPALAQTDRFIPLKEYQLTTGPGGHTLNYTQCFSPDDRWLVYDTRNDGTQIGSTCCIEKVNVENSQVVRLYQAPAQTAFGPGVGAAAYHPFRDQVIFIHGLRNCNAQRPYSFTRRTGVSIKEPALQQPVFMDARDVLPPFTAGALRGGTHAHSWSGDGEWLSFTYNDDVLLKLNDSAAGILDLRTIGIMAPVKKVFVEKDTAGENNSGEYFSVLAATMTEKPKWGSDEIEKAFDEGWIGRNGYHTVAGARQKRAVAFQGDTRDSSGSLVTEVFVADLPENITIAVKGNPLEGTVRSRPHPPAGAVQRRVSFTNDRKYPGIQGPRHWLRSSPDGEWIFCLMKDDAGIVQIFSVSVNGGAVTQVTGNAFSVQSAFSISPDGKFISYVADNSVFVTYLESGTTQRLTPRVADEEKPEGGMVWSHNGKMLAYNRYVAENGKRWLQIFVLK